MHFIDADIYNPIVFNSEQQKISTTIARLSRPAGSNILVALKALVKSSEDISLASEPLMNLIFRL